MNAITNSIKPLGDTFPEDQSLPREMEKPTDSKVKGLVLPRIGHPNSRSAALLPSATSPRLVIDLLSAMAIPALDDALVEREIELFKRPRATKRPKLKPIAGREIPIGLRRVEGFGWTNPINALMQFLIFLPGLAELFHFVPRSFQCFLDFIEQYLVDQQENLSVSSANTPHLVRCLMKKLPSSLFRSPNRANIYEIFQALIKDLFPHVRIPISNPLQNDSVAFHPEWHVIWELGHHKSLDDAIQKKWQGKPQEILVAVKGTEGTSCRLVNKQFFTELDCHCYDLDAFIELRPDGAKEAHFVTYLKVDGGWYQCDDERITALRSHSLSVPLYRSVLLHYKRVALSKPNSFQSLK